MKTCRVVVALPVKDEAERIAACLDALNQQDITADLTIFVLVNNASDESAAIARRHPVRAVVQEVELADPDASAGGARRLAMHHAAELAGDDGVVLTTDADGRVARDWLRCNLLAIAAGADAVAGRAVIDPIDEARIPLALRAADARECHYATLLDEISAAIDPDPADPWPRHDEHSGASIAVTVDALHRAGGVPALPLGEDRAFFDSLRRIDARIRHAPDVCVTVSGRTDGRAQGGMADTIRRRLVCPDVFLDDRLEPARDAEQRARLRRRARLAWAESVLDYWAILALARDLRLPAAFVHEKLASRRFGAAWDELQDASPALRRRSVPAAAIAHEIAVATAILADPTSATACNQAIGMSA